MWPIVIQLTGTIQRKRIGKNEQVLDKLKVERERGITGVSHIIFVKLLESHPYILVKAQTARCAAFDSPRLLVCLRLSAWSILSKVGTICWTSLILQSVFEITLQGKEGPYLVLGSRRLFMGGIQIVGSLPRCSFAGLFRSILLFMMFLKRHPRFMLVRVFRRNLFQYSIMRETGAFRSSLFSTRFVIKPKFKRWETNVKGR